MRLKMFTHVYVFGMFIPLIRGPIPGTFFWKPRVGISLRQGGKPSKEPCFHLARQNMRDGKVVLVDAYSVGLTGSAMMASIDREEAVPHLDPFNAVYYTNAYRWFRRHIDLVQEWMAQRIGGYGNTHKVWNRRFYNTDVWMPAWLQKLVAPWVKKAEWKKEKDDFALFTKYAEPRFGKYKIFPSKTFNYFKTWESSGKPSLESESSD